MLQELLKSVVKVFDGGTAGTVYLSIASTGVKAEFQAVAPIRVLKWGVIATTLVASQTAAAQLSLIQRTAPGVTAAQATVDTLTLGANATSPYGVLAIGSGAYRDPWTTSTTATTPASQVSNSGPEGDSGTFDIVSGQQQLTLSAGQALAFNVVTAPDVSGVGLLFLEYVLLPITRPSGYGFPGNLDPDYTAQPGSVSLTDIYTRYAS
jgi:hypothetical protein